MHSKTVMPLVMIILLKYDETTINTVQAMHHITAKCYKHKKQV